MKLVLVIAMINVIFGVTNTSNWMELLRDDIRLSEVVMPGSHDSGTYALTSRIQSEPLAGIFDRFVEIFCRSLQSIGVPIWNIITPWSTTQTQTIFNQAMLGIRYFDIRAGWNGTFWNTFHMEEGSPVSDVLFDIKRFVDLYTKEIIVIEIIHYQGEPPKYVHEQLETMIMKILGKYLYPCEFSIRVCVLPTLGLMRLKNKRIILGFTDYYNNVSPFNKNPYIWSQYLFINTFANTDNLKEMMEYNHNAMMFYKKNKYRMFTNNLFKISWTLTPQIKTIALGFFPKMPHSIFDITFPIIPYFEEWADKLNTPPANIIIFDYIPSYQIFPYILKWNNLTIR